MIVMIIALIIIPYLRFRSELLEDPAAMREALLETRPEELFRSERLSVELRDALDCHANED
jgi:hypothetical protein